MLITGARFSNHLADHLACSCGAHRSSPCTAGARKWTMKPSFLATWATISAKFIVCARQWKWCKAQKRGLVSDAPFSPHKCNSADTTMPVGFGLPLWRIIMRSARLQPLLARHRLCKLDFVGRDPWVMRGLPCQSQILQACTCQAQQHPQWMLRWLQS